MATVEVVQEQMVDWIPTGWYNPLKAGYYIVTKRIDGGGIVVREAFWEGDRWRYGEDVLAWMPVPKKYSKDDISGANP